MRVRFRGESARAFKHRVANYLSLRMTSITLAPLCAHPPVSILLRHLPDYHRLAIEIRSRSNAAEGVASLGGRSLANCVVLWEKNVVPGPCRDLTVGYWVATPATRVRFRPRSFASPLISCLSCTVLSKIKAKKPKKKISKRTLGQC